MTLLILKIQNDIINSQIHLQVAVHDVLGVEILEAVSQLPEALARIRLAVGPLLKDSVEELAARHCG